MIDILFIVFVAIVAYNMGVSVTAWRLRDLIYKEAKSRGLVTEEEQEILEPKTSATVFKLWVEKVNDILYLYDHEKDLFICQATTIDELAKLALEYKNIKYAAVIMDDQAYAFVNGVVKTKL